jgi:2-polyprenyl-3-methyl-5-hydroxy-6-metoxy-1,4-benzoquinol methylase
MNEIAKKKIKKCCACGKADLQRITDMPQFPHVGIFIDSEQETEKYPLTDNAVNVCSFCGHVQLEEALDPGFLYTSEFQHKTSASASAKQANDFLYDFATRVCHGQKLELVAEIGCNDTFLLQKFAESGIDVAGVDPIFKNNEDRFIEGLSDELKSKFSVIGDFVENVDFESAIGKSPDLYLTNFVFEHLYDPFSVAQALVNSAKPDATIIIGVPGAEFLLLNSRFDQLSHQHYQQFTVPSFTHMIERAGGEIIDIAVNFTNWGQILIAFRKSTPKVAEKVDMALTPEQVHASFATFQNQLDFLKKRISSLGDKEIYGFGAAQNFPIFAYFYKDALPFNTIFDDHPMRQNKTYPHVSVRITQPADSYQGAVGFLSATDYGRVLVGRMSQLKFDHIILPFSII